MKVLHITHGALGGIGRVEQLLGAVWARDDAIEVTTLKRMPETKARWLWTIFTTLLLNRPDVVLLNHLNFAPLALMFRVLRPRTRLMLWVYGVEAWKRPTRPQRWSLRLIDQAWSISRHTAMEFAAASGFRTARIAIVPLALLPELSRALRQERHDPADGCDVLAVSRLWTRDGEGKGIDHLIEAIAEIHPPARLLIVGDGDDRPRLQCLADALGVRSRVIFLGQTDDQTLVDLYRRCRVFALPSQREGFGLAVLEAMTAGKPVVAARAAATPELVADGESGLLIPYGDRRALAGAIQSLIDNPVLAHDLGHRGKQLAVERFGFNRFADQVITLLGGGSAGVAALGDARRASDPLSAAAPGRPLERA